MSQGSRGDAVEGNFVDGRLILVTASSFSPFCSSCDIMHCYDTSHHHRREFSLGRERTQLPRENKGPCFGDFYNVHDLRKVRHVTMDPQEAIGASGLRLEPTWRLSFSHEHSEVGKVSICIWNREKLSDASVLVIIISYCKLTRFI